MLLERLFPETAQFGAFFMQGSPTREPVRLAKAIQEPGSLMPESFTLIVELIESGRYVKLPLSRTKEPAGLRYEYENMEFVNANGSALPKAKRAVDDDSRALVRAYFDRQPTSAAELRHS